MYTLDEVVAAVEADDCIGFCTACGQQADGVEPDARGYECVACGECAVFGAEELLLMGGSVFSNIGRAALAEGNK